MRDKADLSTLLSGGDLEDLEAPIDRAESEAIRKKYKLADVRFHTSASRNKTNFALYSATILSTG